MDRPNMGHRPAGARSASRASRVAGVAGVAELRVGVADFAVTRAGLLVTTGLGSCVAIALHDADVGVGALAHILLPDPALSQDGSNPAKFPCTAVPLLMAEMVRLGGGGRVTARLAGGASMFRTLLASSGLNIGERNVLAARRALEAARVPVVGEDVGGEHGRSVYFDVATGAITVRSMRAGDRAL